MRARWLLLAVVSAPRTALTNSGLQQQRADHILDLPPAQASSCPSCLEAGGEWGLQSAMCWRRRDGREQSLTGGEEGRVSRVGGGAMASCPGAEREARWHYDHGARRWPASEAAGAGDDSRLDGNLGASCGDMDGVLPNSTAGGTVSIGADELQAAVLDTAARAAARILRCGAVALRWNTAGVLHGTDDVFAGMRRSVLHALDLGSDDAGGQPPVEISPNDFLLSDHASRGRDRYEMVIPFGAGNPRPAIALFGAYTDWHVRRGSNVASTLAEVLRRSPSVVLAASAILGLPAHVEMISALVAMPGAVGGPLTQPSGPGTDHRVIVDIPLLPRLLQSDTSRRSIDLQEDGYEEPSIAICMGDSHQAWWWGGGMLSPIHDAARHAKQQHGSSRTEQKQAQSSNEATVEQLGTEGGEAAASNSQSCTEEQVADGKQCKARATTTDTLKPGRAASSRSDGASNEGGPVLIAAAGNGHVEETYGHDTVAERVCTCSVQSYYIVAEHQKASNGVFYGGALTIVCRLRWRQQEGRFEDAATACSRHSQAAGKPSVSLASRSGAAHARA